MTQQLTGYKQELAAERAAKAEAAQVATLCITPLHHWLVLTKCNILYQYQFRVLR